MDRGEDASQTKPHEECSICKLVSVTLPCGHWGCRLCIISEGKINCPVCSKQIKISPQEYLYILYLIRSHK
jgi:hypothetical protein